MIEVVIVVTLITTVMATSLPMLSSANAKARSELCQQNLMEIGQSIASFSHDHGQFPSLGSDEPASSSLSLARFLAPRLHTPHGAFCPSDETQTSQTLGTSYRWNPAFNAINSDAYDTLLGQPVLSDRQAYHPNAPKPINELVIRPGNVAYQLTLPSTIPPHAQPGLPLHYSSLR